MCHAHFPEETGMTGVSAVKELRLQDYKPTTHLIDKTHLTYELNAIQDVIVTNRMTIRPNPASQESTSTIVLDGAPEKAPEGAQTPTMILLEIRLNARLLSADEYTRSGETLTIPNLPAQTNTLEIKTRLNPEANLALAGLYAPNGKLLTQNEPEGFRNMTFYLDRPDAVSEFTTTLIAEKGKFQYLLSNGNRIEQTTTADGREQITWHNPFPMSTYTFAAVAGNFGNISDTYITKSGKKVLLNLYVDPGDESKGHHALDSLKKFLEWDERNWGREYDLDEYQIVVTNDFNMGAMENKGLNIFNASAALADPKTATDGRYEVVQAVIGHEATHNWRGNRVSVRDWFQVSLKEGFTTFTEQEFTADMNSRPVKRIDDVNDMRTRQFPEDAGPMAHPIRPAAVGSIENFYTPTVYEKGAEVIRMIQTLIGKTAFRKGSDLYFDRHDGQAVTTEDFVKAMVDASGVDLFQFEQTWYNQAGTPTLDVMDAYDATTLEYRLTLRQSTPATPGQATKAPFHIPVRIGLLNEQGNDLPLQLKPSQADLLTNGDILNLKDNEATFVFTDVYEKPVPSLLRNWSAPVKLNYAYTRDELTFLAAHDNDGFSRWDAAQKLGEDVLKELVSAHQKGENKTVDSHLIEAFRAVLEDLAIDPSLASRTLILPSTTYLAELYPAGQVDVDAIDAARKQARKTIGQVLEPLFMERFNTSRSSESHQYDWNPKDVGERAIKNTALSYLIVANPTKYLPLALTQFDQNHNMTDIRASLGHIINHADETTRQLKLDSLYAEIKDNKLAIDQWFSEQAFADRADVLKQVKALTRHESYNGKNPNSVRSLIGGFTANTVHFHNRNGEGYRFLADQIIDIDKFNPSLAGGLTKRLADAYKFDQSRQQLMKAELQRIQNQTKSDTVQEIVLKTLNRLS